jgi:fatty acid-binding protein DegV
MKEGVVTPLTRLRSMASGADYLYNYIKGIPHIEELAVEHATAPHEADALTERLGVLFPKERIYRSTMSPVLGTYMGPNVLSVTALEAAA